VHAGPPGTVGFGALSALRNNFGKQSRSHHKKTLLLLKPTGLVQ